VHLAKVLSILPIGLLSSLMDLFVLPNSLHKNLTMSRNILLIANKTGKGRVRPGRENPYRN
jgi:hypothetical protein